MTEEVRCTSCVRNVQENERSEIRLGTFYGWVRGVETKRNYVEVLRFKQFHDYYSFLKDEQNFKKKVMKKYFDVSVVVDLECGDTRNS